MPKIFRLDLISCKISAINNYQALGKHFSTDVHITLVTAIDVRLSLATGSVLHMARLIGTTIGTYDNSS